MTPVSQAAMSWPIAFAMFARVPQVLLAAVVMRLARKLPITLPRSWRLPETVIHFGPEKGPPPGACTSLIVSSSQRPWGLPSTSVTSPPAVWMAWGTRVWS